MDQILRTIEEEIDRRVNDRLNDLLGKISRTYDIPLRQLLRDLSTAQTGGTCLGLTAKKTRCTRPGHFDGYCKVHKDQKPVTRVVVTPAPTVAVTATVQHTHTLPPLFVRGCPACERTSTSRLCI